uniref:Uncharacterized protein n=1 Tax=Oryza punctata TaxID=4537 RepID=A0A0E0JVD4_ORYPU
MRDKRVIHPAMMACTKYQLNLGQSRGLVTATNVVIRGGGDDTYGMCGFISRQSAWDQLEQPFFSISGESSSLIGCQLVVVVAAIRT